MYDALKNALRSLAKREGCGIADEGADCIGMLEEQLAAGPKKINPPNWFSYFELEDRLAAAKAALAHNQEQHHLSMANAAMEVVKDLHAQLAEREAENETLSKEDEITLERMMAAESERDSLKRQLEAARTVIAMMTLTGMGINFEHAIDFYKAVAFKGADVAIADELTAPPAEHDPCPCCGKPASLKEFEVCDECKKAFEGVGKPAPAAEQAVTEPACKHGCLQGCHDPMCPRCGGKPSGRG